MSKFALLSASGLKDKKFIQNKPTRKLKNANSILEYFEHFCQMASKSIVIISSYTVSKFMRFFETQCSCCCSNWCVCYCSCYCAEHRPKQAAASPKKQRLMLPTCAICMTDLDTLTPNDDVLLVPCCQREMLHRDCLQVVRQY